MRKETERVLCSGSRVQGRLAGSRARWGQPRSACTLVPAAVALAIPGVPTAGAGAGAQPAGAGAGASAGAQPRRVPPGCSDTECPGLTAGRISATSEPSSALSPLNDLFSLENGHLPGNNTCFGNLLRTSTLAYSQLAMFAFLYGRCICIISLIGGCA